MGERLTGRPLTRRVVLAMIKRRAVAAGLPASTCCHTFRATGITAYLLNGGPLAHAQVDHGARVGQDDEALRPDGGHGHGRRDRVRLPALKKGGRAGKPGFHSRREVGIEPGRGFGVTDRVWRPEPGSRGGAAGARVHGLPDSARRRGGPPRRSSARRCPGRSRPRGGHRLNANVGEPDDL